MKDHLKVIAIHPYVKAADSDELSFNSGDILIVQNDLSQYAEGWLWCTNERTAESGLVFKGLVAELDDDIDPNELFPWFHSNISKEDAVDKLAKMGPGSFLVRKSERSPGNFSLFFHINNTVQRFRIEKVGDRYIMGGRTFDSLDAVIKRYQREQIVEGYCLGDPVLKPPMQVALNRSPRNGISSSPGHLNSGSISTSSNSTNHPSDPSNQDVYATLRESKEQAQKKQSGLMKGYLYMKSMFASSSFIIIIIITFILMVFFLLLFSTTTF